MGVIVSTDPQGEVLPVACGRGFCRTQPAPRPTHSPVHEIRKKKEKKRKREVGGEEEEEEEEEEDAGTRGGG